MGVDDDGVGVGDGVEGSAGLGGEVGGEGEVAAVGCIDVDAEVVIFSGRVRIWSSGSTEPMAVVPRVTTTVPMFCPGFEELLESGEVHAAAVVGGDGDEGQAEDA